MSNGRSLKVTSLYPLNQGKLVPKLSHGAFLTLSVRAKSAKLFFQVFTSLNPSRFEQNYTIHL